MSVLADFGVLRAECAAILHGSLLISPDSEEVKSFRCHMKASSSRKNEAYIFYEWILGMLKRDGGR